MPVWFWVVLAFLCLPVVSLLLFVSLSPLVSFFQRRSIAKACVRTENFLRSPSFGLVTYICGNIGAGKTTCGSAICNVLSKIKREQANLRAGEIRTVFAGLDFNKVDSVIALAFKSKFTNTDAVLDFLFRHFPDVRGFVRGKFYDDGLYPVSYTSLLRDYVDSVVALVRNRYVYFNRRKFYCWTTDTWAMNYTPDMIDLKDRYEGSDYRIQRYTVIFEDEKILSGKVSTNYQEVAKEDGGGDTFLRLIRQLGKGTIHYISTAQDFTRVVKSERELATGVLYVRKRTEIPVVDLKSVFLQMAMEAVSRFSGLVDGFVDSVNSSRYGRLDRRVKMCEAVGVPPSPALLAKRAKCSSLRSKSASWSKRVLSRLSVSLARLNADGYIRYKGVYYTCADDVGKPKEECSGAVLDCDLTFPVRYAYGSTDTYAFSVLNDYLSLRSVKSSDWYDPSDHFIPRENPRDFADYFRGVLSKKKK